MVRRDMFRIRGTLVYAVRDKLGRFKDIIKVSRSRKLDIRKVSKAERQKRRKAKKKRRR